MLAKVLACAPPCFECSLLCPTALFPPPLFPPQAGEYDQAATRAKIDSLIASNPVRSGTHGRTMAQGQQNTQRSLLPPLLPPPLVPCVPCANPSPLPPCPLATRAGDGV